MKVWENYKGILLIGIILGILSVFYISCKKSSPAVTQGPNEVWIQNMSYSPTSLTVAVNTTVKWTNKDGTDHTVSSDSSLFDSGHIPGGSTYSRQFTSAGIYPYHCNIHAGMNGNIVVH